MKLCNIWIFMEGTRSSLIIHEQSLKSHFFSAPREFSRVDKKPEIVKTWAHSLVLHFSICLKFLRWMNLE